MNIIVDENIPQTIAAYLRRAGHQVRYTQRQTDDRIVLEDAYQRKALLITTDKDFERLVFEERHPTMGVIQLRTSRSIPVKDRAQILVNLIKHRQRELQGAYTILTETIVDIRRAIP